MIASTLPPAGGFPSLADIGEAARELKQILNRAPSNGQSGEFELAARSFLAERLGAEQAFLTGSGTHALALVLVALKRARSIERAILSAYTCPELVTAVRAAGLEAHCCDIDPDTLDLKRESLEQLWLPNKTVVILSNLYGLIDSVPQIEGPESVIDDGCQGGLGLDTGFHVGTRATGVLSFGRGKAFGAIGGGAILLSKRSSNEEFHRVLKEEFKSVVALGSIADSLSVAKLLAFKVLSNPLLYTIPSSIPQLRLGETVYHAEVNRNSFPRFAVLAGIAQVLYRGDRRLVQNSNARRWSEALLGMPVTEPFLLRKAKLAEGVGPIRYPILTATPEKRDELLRSLNKVGLGASPSYPSTLHKLCKGEPALVRGDCPGAESAASRILTLPVHAGVKPAHIERAAEIFQTVLKA